MKELSFHHRSRVWRSLLGPEHGAALIQYDPDRGEAHVSRLSTSGSGGSWDDHREWAQLWAEHDFPRLLIGSKQAALLMTTGAPVSGGSRVTPPWTAFLIALRQPLRCNRVGRPELVKHLAVYRRGAVTSHTRLVPADEEVRCVELLTRLTVGACALLGPSEPSASMSPCGTAEVLELPQGAMARDFEFGDAGVEEDLRPAIAAYVTGSYEDVRQLWSAPGLPR